MGCFGLFKRKRRSSRTRSSRTAAPSSSIPLAHSSNSATPAPPPSSIPASSSAPPPPPPAPPAPIAHSSAPRRSGAPTQGTSKLKSKKTYPPGSIGIGIETEFLLTPRDPGHAKDDKKEFSRAVAAGYNSFLGTNAKDHPKMHNAILEDYRGLPYTEWSLDFDSTIVMPNLNAEPWGLENISPIFRAYKNSSWRDHVQIMWDYLDSNYTVTANNSCGTHVHISFVDGYTLDELKMICQSIIYFEPAFEAILPQERLRNIYARSNWLDNDNFAKKGLDRQQSIARIGQCQEIRDLVLLMNPDRNKFFGWNLLYLLESPNGTIEFRRGAASTSVQDVYMWVELAMSFVKASSILGTPENLQRAPPTVGGLRAFINQARLPEEPGFFDSRMLNPLFNRVNDRSFVEPRPLGDLSNDDLRKLKKKKDEDEKKTLMMKKMLQEPYWD